MKLRQGIVILLLLLTAIPAAAQDYGSPKAKAIFAKAMKAWQDKQLDKVITYCNDAIAESPKWDEPYTMLSTVYMMQHKTAEELKVYDKLKEINPDAYSAYVNAADAYLRIEDYDKAFENYEQLLHLSTTPPKYKEMARKQLANVSTIKRLVANPVPFNAENQGPNINSKFDEYFPVFTVDGQTMYFTRRKIADSFMTPVGKMYKYNEDLMMSPKQGIGWGPARDIPGDINTNNNEGAMAIAPDGSYLIFTRCERIQEGESGGCELYISFFIDGKWTKPVNMGTPVNSRWNEKQPSISYDGRTIYFCSDRPGTFGKLDIWSSTRDDAFNFSEPVNLGPVINTTEDDQYPYIHPDDHTLYFCSVGHPGMGRNDIYYVHKTGVNTWDSAVNLGYPINTTGDEPGLMVDRLGEYAYYSSDHGKTYGGLDIMRFKLPDRAKPKVVTYLKGRVYDAYTKQPLKADLDLVDLASGKSVLKATTDASGELLATVPGGRDYMVNVSAKGYLFYSENIPLKDYKKTAPYEQDIPMHPIKAGEKIALRNIFFDSDAFNLKKESTAELDKLIQFLKDNPAVKLEISGHTDNTGSATHNKELSQKRAQAVVNYLVSTGKISADRLTSKGYGADQPMAPNTTDAGKALNRRTEIKVQ